MDPTEAPISPLEEMMRTHAQHFAEQYIQAYHPYLEKVQGFCFGAHSLDQLWQIAENDTPTHWVFFSLILSGFTQDLSGGEIPDRGSRAYLEYTFDEMLLSHHVADVDLCLDLRAALEGDRLSYYSLTICLKLDQSLESIDQIEIDLASPLPASPLLVEPQLPPLESPIQTPIQSTVLALAEPSPSTESFASPSAPALDNPQSAGFPIASEQVRQLTLQLSPPGFPLTIKLNRTLKTLTEIKATKDRYGYSNNLFLEYSPQATESEVLEQSTRLSLYQFLRYLAHLHRFLQEQILNWHQQNGQPSAGSSSLSLQQSITELGEQLCQRIQDLTEAQLQSHATVELQEELDQLSAEQQQQKNHLEQIEQNPLLGYLDFHFLERGDRLQLHQFFNASDQPIDIYAQYLKRQDSSLFLSRIESCHSVKYQSYRQSYKEGLDLTHFVKYAITQKLYPNRPISIGPAPTPAYPRLEWLWGAMDLPTLPHNPLNQIWRIFPMSRTDPPQWLIIAATVDGESLKSIGLENGQVVQEGTSEYLGRSLQLMSQTDDEYTCTLSRLVREAFEQKRVKYLHFHQTQNLETGEPRDIVQLQFQLYR
jgi:hypothetical protein